MRPSVLGLLVLLVAVAGIVRLRNRRLTAAPARIAPIGAVRADTTVRFAWHPVPGAIRYTIDVSNANGIPVASAATLGDTTLDVSTLALSRGVSYRWSVTATDARGHIQRSPPVSFTVHR